MFCIPVLARSWTDEFEFAAINGFDAGAGFARAAYTFTNSSFQGGDLAAKSPIPDILIATFAYLKIAVLI